LIWRDRSAELEKARKSMIPRRPFFSVAAAALAWLASAGVSNPAKAAVKVCMAPVSSGLATGATENEAKRRAIEAWVARVKPLGPKFTGWGVAGSRTLKCVKGKGGQYECVALATPCTIEQAPPKAKPKRRIGTPGKPLEV